jgi:hypothetical protein
MRVCLLVLAAGWTMVVRAADAAPYQIAPAAIDFGPIDLQGPSPMRTVTLTNTSSAALDVGAATVTGSTAFAASTTSAIHLAAGASETVTVTYCPTVEQTDDAMLTFPIGTTPVTVTLAGRGIDRHLMVTPATFPDTYRNPGTTAPVRAVTITNTGGASLAITSLSLTGAPTWQLLDDDPVDIPGDTSYDVDIRFVPTTTGIAPPGTLTITSNDTAQPSITINLAGKGVLRKVAMGPPVIDLGYTGVDVPIDAPLTITNDDATAFTVQALTIGDQAFSITTDQGQPTDKLPLPASMATPLDVAFVASAPGDYHTTAILFLDQDPDAQTSVVLLAHAEVIDAHGGAGCSAGGDAGLGVVVLALVLVLRRKRWALLVVPAVASADPARNIDVSIFDPTPTTQSTGFQLVTPGIGEPGAVVATALLTYASHPLVLSTPQADDVAIANRMTLVLGGAYAVSDRLELGAHMPLMIQNGQVSDPTMQAGTPPIASGARGNLTLHARTFFIPGLGALATLELPTSSDDRFAGTGEPAAHLLALSSFTIIPHVTATLDFGAVLRGESKFANITERSGAAWGAGATYFVHRGVTVTGELYGELIPGGQRDAMNQSSVLATTELLAGVHVQLDPLLQLGAAVGRGVVDGPGSPAFRAVLTLSYSPRLGMPPLPPRRVFTPGEDSDHDGIPDSSDRCPTMAEDKDGFEDDDGCPDPDNDGDGIPDAQDKCPNAPEDKDGFEDSDGCPDLDNDHDGIPDMRDACPAEAETINGVDDDDGCPDVGEPGAVVTAERIELRIPLKFDGALITEGASVLGQVGSLMRAHDEIALLRIVVHAPDVTLAERRATAIRDWLIQWGVADSRLEARGAGGDEAVDLFVVH